MFVCCLIAGRFVGNWRSCGVFAWKKAVSNLYIRHSGAIPFVYGRWHRRSYEWLENCVLTATLSSFSLQFDQLHAFSYKGIFLNAACSWIQTHTIGWCTGLCECYDCRIATINYSICIFPGPTHGNGNGTVPAFNKPTDLKQSFEQWTFTTT